MGAHRAELLEKVIEGARHLAVAAALVGLAACSGGAGDDDLAATADSQASQLVPVGGSSIFDGAGVFVCLP